MTVSEVPLAPPEDAAWFRALVDEASDAIARVAYVPTPHFAYVNQAQCALTGYAADEFYADIGIAQRIVHPDDREKIARMREGDSPLRMRIVRKDGAIRWVESRSRALRDAAGKLVAVESVNRDVTERVAAETALRESEARFRASVDNMLDGFSIYRAVRAEDGRIVDFVIQYANPAASVALRRPLRELVGGSMTTLFPGAAASPVFAQYVRVVDTGEPLALDAQPGLSGMLFDVRATRVGDGFAVTWRDVTERVTESVNRKLARHLLRTLGRGASLSAATRRELGRRLAREAPDGSIEALLAAGRSLGLGDVRLVATEGDRATFEGQDLLEVEPGERTTTCMLALGFLEGAWATVQGATVLGAEVECRSAGAARCRFVVAKR